MRRSNVQCDTIGHVKGEIAGLGSLGDGEAAAGWVLAEGMERVWRLEMETVASGFADGKR